MVKLMSVVDNVHGDVPYAFFAVLQDLFLLFQFISDNEAET